MLRLFDLRRRSAGSLGLVAPAARLVLGGTLLSTAFVGCNSIGSRPATARKCLDPNCNEHAHARNSMSAGLMRGGVVPAAGWMDGGMAGAGAMFGGGNGTRPTSVPHSVIDSASKYPIVQTGGTQPAPGSGPMSGSVSHADLTTPFAPAAPMPAAGIGVAPRTAMAPGTIGPMPTPAPASQNKSMWNWLKGPVAGRRKLGDGSLAGQSPPAPPVRMAAQPQNNVGAATATGSARLSSSPTFDPAVPAPPATPAAATQRGYGPAFDPNLFEDVPRQ